MTVATASAGLLSTNVGEGVMLMRQGGIGQIRYKRNEVRQGGGVGDRHRIIRRQKTDLQHGDDDSLCSHEFTKSRIAPPK